MEQQHRTLYREFGGLDHLVIIGEVPDSPGMVIVGRAGEDFEHHPELRWRCWRDLLTQM